MIESTYPKVRFDEILSRIERPIILDDATEYSSIGVRWYGNGAYIRETKLGIEYKRKKQWIVRSGDILYNKLFAWKGAFAVTDDELSGCLASDKFPTYQFNKERVSSDFLRLWFRTPFLAAHAESMSKGAAAISKLTLNPPDFLNLEIPLPKIEEQRLITQKVNNILDGINKITELRFPIDAVVQGKRAGIGSEVRLLMNSALENMNREFSFDLGILDSILTLRPRSGPSFVVSEEGDGIPVIMPSATLGYRYNPSKILYGDGTEIINHKDLVKNGDLLITRGNYTDQVGICVVYRDGGDRRTYANLIMKMQVDSQKVIPEFVKYWIMSPICVRYIRKNTKGTSPSVQKINQKALINMPFPNDVPLGAQKKWVEYLDSIFDRVEILEKQIREQYVDIELAQTIVLKAAFEEGLSKLGDY